MSQRPSCEELAESTMRIKSNLTVLQVCRIKLCFFLILAGSTSIADEVAHIKLKTDGSALVLNSSMPTCDTGRKINIQSYKYLRMMTEGSIKINLPEGNLSTEAEMHLYELCSFKQNCSNISFPNVDLEQHNFSTVFVTYKCEDLEVSIFDMCTTWSDSFNRSIQLIAENVTGFEECKCYLSMSYNGSFRVEIHDLRLRSRESGNCSTATLKIDNENYTCNKNEENFGSVFGRYEAETRKNLTTSLITGTAMFDPEMVWLSLKPNEEMKIECTVKTRADNPHDNSGEEVQWMVPVIAASALLLLAALAVLLFKRMLSTKITRSNDSGNTAKNHTGTRVSMNRNEEEEREISQGDGDLGQKEENAYACIADNYNSRMQADDFDPTYDDTAVVYKKQRIESDYNHLHVSVGAINSLVPRNSDVYSLAKDMKQLYSQESLE